MHCIDSLADGHLSYFHTLTTVNNVAKSTAVLILFPLDIYPVVELLVHKVVIIFSFLFVLLETGSFYGAQTGLELYNSGWSQPTSRSSGSAYRELDYMHVLLLLAYF